MKKHKSGALKAEIRVLVLCVHIYVSTLGAMNYLTVIFIFMHGSNSIFY